MSIKALQKTYTDQEATALSLAYFNNNSLAASVFINKYALRDKLGKILEPTPTEMHWRLAKEFARMEKKKYRGTSIKPYTAQEIFDKLENFSEIIPQGSPMYAIGNDFQRSSASNCFVADAPEDSYAGIMHTDQQLVQLSKRRAGVGVDVSLLRPKGMPTRNAARSTTGIVTFCERYSNSIREVGQNGRRGALMLSIDIRHPESVKLYATEEAATPYVIASESGPINTTTEFYNPDDIDFCTMKLDAKRVTGANVSIRLTDEFLKCVKDDKPFIQRWPIDGAPEEAEYTTTIDARRAWAKIIHCAWLKAEPGILFWDNIVSESPADCYTDVGFRTISTNPCGEIPLPALDSCRLLVVNLVGCVKDAYKDSAEFDFVKLYDNAYFAQRLMDDLIDLEAERVQQIIDKIEADPESEELKVEELSLWKGVQSKCLQGRRTGTGILGIGDALAASGVVYGSTESIAVCDKIYGTLKKAAYTASVDMAEAIGAFPVWDPKKELECSFLLRISEENPELYDRMQKVGRRNISLLTTAPTGSISILAQIIPGHHGTTGGIEPNYSNVPYTRKKKINPDDEGVRVDSTDQNGDHWQHFDVFPAGVTAWMEVTGKDDVTESPYQGAAAEELDWRQRVLFQATAQSHVDHSISSTVNLPADVSEEKVSEIYRSAWEMGLKGVTVYRDGCRTGVLVKAEATNLHTDSAPKRPKTLEADIHLATAKGVQYIVAVGLVDGQPYEVFGGCANGFGIKKTCKGNLVKHKKGQYGLEIGDMSIDDFSTHFTLEEQTIFRLASTNLRHGIPIEFTVEQLQKSTGDMFSLPSAVARVLKKYIKDGQKVSGQECPDCGNASLVYQEGCVSCKCGWSKCT